MSDRHLQINRYVDGYKPQDVNTEKRLRYRLYGPLCKMIRRSLLVNYDVFFDEVKYSNDVMFSAKVGYYARSIRVSDRVVCCITSSPNSLTKKINKEALMCRYKVVVNYNKFLDKIGEKRFKAVILRYFIMAIRCNMSCLISMLRLSVESNINLFDGLNKLPEMFYNKGSHISHF